MPTYDYVCTKCAHEFELVQRITDPPRSRCPKCRGKVERKIGAGAGLLFKGSGFYITDYRKPDYKAKEKADKSGGSSPPPTKPEGKAKKSDSTGTKGASGSSC
ncbi:MAG: FmdB family zinc ribbon protein [Candidatus Eisenbacteria bacterium]